MARWNAGQSPEFSVFPKACTLFSHLRHSHGRASECVVFLKLPDWAPYTIATCNCIRAWRAAMAASSPGKQQSGTVGCREYTLILVPSVTALCSRASARVPVRGAARMRHFHAKERAGNAGSKRASERLLPKSTDASSVHRPTPGTPFRHLADFRPFFETGQKTQIRTKSIRTGYATATRRCIQAAARLAFHCAHCIVKRVGEPPPRFSPGRRASCVDRVPSASKKKTVETTRGLNRPGVYQ